MMTQCPPGLTKTGKGDGDGDGDGDSDGDGDGDGDGAGAGDESSGTEEKAEAEATSKKQRLAGVGSLQVHAEPTLLLPEGNTIRQLHRREGEVSLSGVQRCVILIGPRGHTSLSNGHLCAITGDRWGRDSAPSRPPQM